MSGTLPPNDTTRCPLCGRENECAVAQDLDPAGCWCRIHVFPPELLARVPEHLRHVACICRECLEAAVRDAAP